MKCEIYRCSKKAGTYLYVSKKGNFSRVPDSLMKLLGTLDHVMNLELTSERKLAQADPDEVRRNILEKGFYLQLPPSVYNQV